MPKRGPLRPSFPPAMSRMLSASCVFVSVCAPQTPLLLALDFPYTRPQAGFAELEGAHKRSVFVFTLLTSCSLPPVFGTPSREPARLLPLARSPHTLLEPSSSVATLPPLPGRTCLTALPLVDPPVVRKNEARAYTHVPQSAFSVRGGKPRAGAVPSLSFRQYRRKVKVLISAVKAAETVLQS